VKLSIHSAKVWLRRAVVALAAAGAVSLALAAPAAASPETLKRSVTNIAFAPLDIVLAPVVAGKTIYNNMRDIDDSRWVRIVYPLPGFVWTTGVQIGGGILREVTGLIELLPGLGLVFLEADLDPLYDPIERGEALVDVETDQITIKFGMNYTSIPY
jgi:hypothetical protein